MPINEEMIKKSNMKFTIVTPCYNCVRFIEECILSIKNQKYGDYEHIIVDGGSIDGTLDIIRKYEGTYNMKWISEKDNGMYDAINKGFAMATGNVYSWLNADDKYFSWTLSEVNKVFQNRAIQWCTAREAFINEESELYFKSKTIGPRGYSKRWIQNGYMDGRILGFIMQESTFWTRELWDKCQGLDAECKLAGDYWLWKKFAQYEQLYLVNTLWACFRKSKSQLTSNMSKYYKELPNLSFGRKILAHTKILFIVNTVINPNKNSVLSMEELL